MKQEVLLGQTDYTVLVKIRTTAGAAATGLTEASIDIAYARVETDNDVTTNDVTPASLSALTDAHSDWGFKEISATDHPGLYRLDIADAVFASGAWSAVVTITGTGLDPADLEFVLIAFNPRDAVRLGLTALPNAAAEAAGGLFTRGSGAGQINQQANGQIDANVERLVNVAQSAADLKDFADDGYDPSTNKVQGVVLVDTLTTYTGNTPQTGDAFARLGAPAGASVSADIADVEGKVDDLESRLGTPSDLGSGATVAANLADIEAQTDNLPGIETKIDTIDDLLDTEVAAIISALSSLATAVNTIDDLLDTEVQTIITMLTGIVPVNGTIGATGNDTTHLHLAGLAYGDDGPNSMLLLIKDVSTGIFVSRWIEDFANTGDLATVSTLPFTPEASVDQYWLLPVRADVTGGSGLDAAGVRAALGMANADLDTQLSTIDNLVDDLESRVGTPSNLGGGATLSANLADIEAQTDDIGVAGAGLTAVPDPAGVTTLLARLTAARAGYLDNINNATLAAAVFPTDPADQSLVIAATNAIASAISALNNLSQADIRTAVGLSSANLDTQLGDLPTNAELATALAAADDAVLAAIAALNNISPAGVRAAIGLASANLDTQLGDLPTNAELAAALAAADDAVLAAIAALSIPTANANADALLDRTNGIETSYTLRQALRIILSATAGKLSGAATTTVAIRNVGDSKDRITATVDEDGNRTAVTLDAT
jgi:hypothetical protein